MRWLLCRLFGLHSYGEPRGHYDENDVMIVYGRRCKHCGNFKPNRWFSDVIGR